MQWMQYRLSRKMPGLELPAVDDILKGTDMLETNIDLWKAQAIAEGKQLGKLEGRVEGEALALQRLLAHRFGPIPSAIVEQIAGANIEQIEAWFDTAISAPHLAAVFPPPEN